MKIIAERAKEYASKIADISLSDIYNEALASIYEEGYIAGAVQQKAIDTEKVKNAFNKTCGWLSTYTWYSEVFDEFMKNMEE